MFYAGVAMFDHLTSDGGCVFVCLCLCFRGRYLILDLIPRKRNSSSGCALVVAFVFVL